MDASVLVKLLVKEEGDEAIINYMKLEYMSTFCATSLCFAEALGAIKSKYLHKEIDQETYFSVGDELRAYFRGSIELSDVDISDSSIFHEVEVTAKRYDIDIVDAYQIVTIKKDFSNKFPNSKPILITADKDLAKAARAEGLRVWNCLTEKAP